MIKNIISIKKNTKEAMDEIISNLINENEELVLTILFISNEFDLSVVEAELRSVKGNIIACTSSGEISNEGLQEGSIVAQAFFGNEFNVENFYFSNLSDFENDINLKDKLLEFKHNTKKIELESNIPVSSFGVLLVDGLSVKEESLCAFLSNCLDDFPILGGSAGDNLEFKETYIYQNGKFIQNGASLTRITTNRKFELFKSQHFTPSEKKLVVTDSIPEKRIVVEINGIPAAECYAELLGLTVDDLNPHIFSKYPLMLNIAGEYYVRSILQVNPDNSLTFYCAIEDGLVLTIANKDSILETDKVLFSSIESGIGEIDSCLLFECILRKLEIIDLPSQTIDDINNVYRSNKTTGFYTYGEQFGSVHINQTLTGVAFGKK